MLGRLQLAEPGDGLGTRSVGEGTILRTVHMMMPQITMGKMGRRVIWEGNSKNVGSDISGLKCL